MTLRVQPVILSGGFGSRLWPLSREARPKQFLRLTGDTSLLQATAERLSALAGYVGGREVAPPLVVSHIGHRFLVEEQLAGIATCVIAEPAGRNTAPALTLAALEAAGEQDCVLVVSPADHHVSDPTSFARALATAVVLAERGEVATLGIAPTRPETGYGYLRRGAQVPDTDAFTVAQFTEKPDAATASQFAASGEYLWNSGVFVLRASRWLELVARHAPTIEQACRQAHAGAVPAEKSAIRTVLPDASAFAACPSDSIDYAVMEKAASTGVVVVVPCAAGWADVGDFAALAEVGERDEHGNYLRGEVVAIDTRDSVVIGQHRLVSALGLRDAVVVETADAVLVTQRARSQDVRQVVAELKARKRPETDHSAEANRPWGRYKILAEGENHRVKWLTVDPGERISLQLHEHRAEHWVVVRGRAHITRGDKTFDLEVNQSTYIPVGVKHRIANLGTEPLEIIEVQCGVYIGEDDIIRFEDKYDRVKPP